mmetsp:Transcript_2822/g.11364  ORF Transcript_2822/g.11364 Transcript_2822/m.11364 type:complete len:742 (-) Transcript_2822:876-3101(-)
MVGEALEVKRLVARSGRSDAEALRLRRWGRHGHGRELLLEVGGVGIAAGKVGRDGRGHFLPEEGPEVLGVAKEGVVHDLAQARSTQPALGVPAEEAADEVARRGRHGHVGGELQLSRAQVPVELGPALCVPRRQAREHLEDKHAEAPPVDGGAVAALLNDLGGEVLGRAAEGGGAGAAGAVLGEAKVADADEACAVNEQVLGLEVAVEDAAVVQVPEAGEDAGPVKGGVGGREGLHLVEEAEELAALHELEHHEEAVVVLEGCDEADEEGVPNGGEDGLLVDDVLLLVEADDSALVEGLEGVEAARAAVADHLDTAKGADAQGGHDLEVRDSKGLVEAAGQAAEGFEGSPDRLEVDFLGGDAAHGAPRGTAAEVARRGSGGARGGGGGGGRRRREGGGGEAGGQCVGWGLDGRGGGGRNGRLRRRGRGRGHRVGRGAAGLLAAEGGSGAVGASRRCGGCGRRWRRCVGRNPSRCGGRRGSALGGHSDCRCGRGRAERRREAAVRTFARAAPVGGRRGAGQDRPGGGRAGREGRGLFGEEQLCRDAGGVGRDASAHSNRKVGRQDLEELAGLGRHHHRVLAWLAGHDGAVADGVSGAREARRAASHSTCGLPCDEDAERRLLGGLARADDDAAPGKHLWLGDGYNGVDFRHREAAKERHGAKGEGRHAGPKGGRDGCCVGLEGCRLDSKDHGRVGHDAHLAPAVLRAEEGPLAKDFALRHLHGGFVRAQVAQLHSARAHEVD